MEEWKKVNNFNELVVCYGVIQKIKTKFSPSVQCECVNYPRACDLFYHACSG